MADHGSKTLADELITSMREQLPKVLGSDGKGLWSVSVLGSYVRGDFFDGNSDLDFHLVSQPNHSDTEGPCFSDGVLAVKGLVERILDGRVLYSHNPYQFDWVTSSWESLPKSQADIHIPDGSPTITSLNIFLFDYMENLLVLWGNDPRKIMPAPLNFEILARGWFDSALVARQRYRDEGNEWRIPFRIFKSIQVAQIVFGQYTLDKQRLLEFYEKHVPDFPLKQFGCRVIRSKMQSKYPEYPAQFDSYDVYGHFEDQLSEVVERKLATSLGMS